MTRIGTRDKGHEQGTLWREYEYGKDRYTGRGPRYERSERTSNMVRTGTRNKGHPNEDNGEEHNNNDE